MLSHPCRSLRQWLNDHRGRKNKPRDPVYEATQQVTEPLRPSDNPRASSVSLATNADNLPSSGSHAVVNDSSSTTVEIEPAIPVEVADDADDANPDIDDKSPIWSRSVRHFTKTQPKLFGMMKEDLESFGQRSVDDWDTWLNNHRKVSNNAWLRRCKAYLPSFKVVKSLAMSLSNLDPHKLAPLVTTGVFVAIELCFESFDPSAQDKAMSVMLKVKVLIDKWADAEIDLQGLRGRFLGSDENLKRIDRIEKKLEVLYIDSLNLIVSVYKAGKTRRSRAASSLILEPAEWDLAYQRLNDKDTDCSYLKGKVELETKQQEANFVILDLIRDRSKDPEPGHQSVKEKTGINNPESIAGNWFLETDAFNSWLSGVRHGETQSQCFWLKGSMGTGKTTLICRILSHYENQPIPGVRLVPYYCFASGTSNESKAPKHETIIRALCCRLAWNSDGGVAQPARDLYNSTRGRDVSFTVTSTWEPLLKDLIVTSKTTIIFVIDALDECKSMEQYNRLLRFLGGLPLTPRGPYFLISSRPHVCVGDHLKPFIHLDAANQKAEHDMKTFITNQLDSKNNKTWAKSIFFNSEGGYRRRLENALFENAGGMFRWVEIWLGVFFPANGKPIRQQKHAGDLLTELEQTKTLDRFAEVHRSESDDNEHKWKYELRPAYQRLWDINGDEQYRALQISAFKVVMGAFESLTPLQLLQAVCLANLHTTLELDELEGLYCNFLKVDNEGCLNFEHHSAKIFLSEMKKEGSDELMFSETECHRALADISINAIEQPEHSIWGDSGINLVDSDICTKTILSNLESRFTVSWSEFSDEPFRELYKQAKKTGISQLSQYLLSYWILHCKRRPKDNQFTRRLIHPSKDLEHWILNSAYLRYKADGYSVKANYNQPFLPDDALILSTHGMETVISVSSLLLMIILGVSPFNPDAETEPTLLAGLGDHVTLSNMLGRVSLHIACASGNNDIVTQLLRFRQTKTGSSTYLLKETDKVGRVPMHYADNEDVLKTLLQYESTNRPVQHLHSELLEKQDKFGDMPLVEMIGRCSDEYLEWILENYSLATVTLERVLQKVIELDKMNIINYILRYEGNIRYSDDFGNTPLTEETTASDMQRLKCVPDRCELLENEPRQGIPSLNKSKASRNLIEQGTRLEISDVTLKEALGPAASRGRVEMAKLLLNKGADPNASRGKYGGALGVAACWNNVEMAQLLLDKGADPNASGGYYESPLGTAASRGHVDIAQLLLDKGADPNASGGYHDSPLATAACRGHVDMAQLLLDKGADPNALGDKYGSALGAAANHGKVEMAQFLLDKGADVNLIGGIYGTPLGNAINSWLDTRLDMIQLLLSRGADIELLSEKDRQNYSNILDEDEDKFSTNLDNE
ncbi:hypothetical protein F4679DRAFT_552030 [Xylaria curta]|nr:hypothetical protein F4679DRAFT_552030 [Xylaria curta]